MSMFKQNKTKSMSTTVTHVLPGEPWVLIGNETDRNRTISITATQAVVFKIIMIFISRHRAAAITLSKSSRAAKSDVELRSAVASMTAITSAEELVINKDY